VTSQLNTVKCRAQSDVFDVVCGVEIHVVIMKIYVMSDIHRIKE
jgi:hypothetical protein